MGFLFIIPLSFIALFESITDRRRHTWVDNWFRGNDEGSEDTPENRDPSVNDPRCQGLEISKVPFEELIQVFPNTAQVCYLYLFLILRFANRTCLFQSSEGTILKEISDVKKQLQELLQKLEKVQSWFASRRWLTGQTWDMLTRWNTCVISPDWCLRTPF